MKRLLIILGLLAVLPGLLISAVFLVLKSMDPEFLRSQLEAALENASGRQVTCTVVSVMPYMLTSCGRRSP